ncbi:MAG: hypothetical protein ABIY62_09010 [Ginsengibacter sp.]
MKNFFYLIIFIMLCMVTFTSCHKDPAQNPTPRQVDSLNAALPKEIISSYSYDSSGVTIPGSYMVAIKYDTVNSAIQLSVDDTTTIGSYALGQTYNYNSSGYLISVKEAGNPGDIDPSDQSYNVVINRDANNKIIYVSETSIDGSVYDSIYYNYQAVSGGMNITTFDHYRRNITNLGIDTMEYKYNSNNRLIELADVSFQTFTNYILNTNNTVKSYTTVGYGDTTFANYSYASGLPDGKADVFVQALLGKDYYMPDIFDQDPFVYSYNAISGYDDFNISFTDPYHVSSATLLNNGYSANPETATWSYQLNAQNNVTQVNYSNNFSNKETVKIKY